MGSPTALVDPQVMEKMKAMSDHGLYIGVGALWGGHDIQRMSERGTLKV